MPTIFRQECDRRA